MMKTIRHKHVVKKNNGWQKLNPFTQGMIALVFIVGALFFGWRFVIVEVVALFFMAYLAGIFKPFLSQWARSALLLTVFVCLLQLLLIPGDQVVFEWGWVSVTDAAVDQATTIAARIMGLFTPVIFFIQLVDMDDFILMMQQSGVSPRVTYIVNAAFQMIPQMTARMETITDAQRSRGVETEGKLWTRLKAFFPIIGPVILSSMADVEEKTISLEVRGFSTQGPKTLLHTVEDSSRDRLIRKILWLVIAVLMIVRVVTWF